MTMDGGLERLVKLLHDFCMCPPSPENAAILYGLSPPSTHPSKLVPTLNPKSFDKHAAYRFSEIYTVSDGRSPLASPNEKVKFAFPGFGGGSGAYYGTLGCGPADEDEVVVETAGTVTFRMWDIHRGEPEARCREACKRAFGLGWCSKRSPEVAIDWDFLLDD